ncbi:MULTISPECIES: hypothetical protein [Stenotrophomonas maltophilia group]|uniref:hypothetical protein n=1 Tax=Stenotrophomonas maltophilia group TaxID=995085 RepID=UPI000DA954F6|nr:hypothetical protein [Stenotrophomonas maltophilia]PZS95073.1 hypothetical protein A7X90_10435 [Stenotrophomonas maltophilia]PZT42676.1 hypothetical protein A7X99_04875 [Stenotrophomonas maltophilia]
MVTLTDTFDDLSHALRLLQEADYRANSGLLSLDRAEAVGNIEITWAGVLNAFHSLYDAMEKDPRCDVDWYAHPELATILVLRNARHHNHARKIRTLYTHYIQEAEKVGRMEMYVLLDFAAAEEGGDTFDLYLSWGDLKDLLEMPQAITRIRPSLALAVKGYLGSEKFAGYASEFHLPEEKVMFNAIPLICNAAARITASIQDLIEPASLEAKTFHGLFKDMPQTDLRIPEVNVGPVAFLP